MLSSICIYWAHPHIRIDVLHAENIAIFRQFFHIVYPCHHRSVECCAKPRNVHPVWHCRCHHRERTRLQILRCTASCANVRIARIWVLGQFLRVPENCCVFRDGMSSSTSAVVLSLQGFKYVNSYDEMFIGVCYNAEIYGFCVSIQQCNSFDFISRITVNEDVLLPEKVTRKNVFTSASQLWWLKPIRSKNGNPSGRVLWIWFSSHWNFIIQN